jgi:hypothetical protein
MHPFAHADDVGAHEGFWLVFLSYGHQPRTSPKISLNH